MSIRNLKNSRQNGCTVVLFVVLCLAFATQLAEAGMPPYGVDSRGINNAINGITGVMYTGTVSRRKEDIYHMNYSSDAKSSSQRVKNEE